MPPGAAPARQVPQPFLQQALNTRRGAPLTPRTRLAAEVIGQRSVLPEYFVAGRRTLTFIAAIITYFLQVEGCVCSLQCCALSGNNSLKLLREGRFMVHQPPASAAPFIAHLETYNASAPSPRGALTMTDLVDEKRRQDATAELK